MTLNVSSSAITIKNSSGTEKVNFSTQELVHKIASYSGNVTFSSSTNSEQYRSITPLEANDFAVTYITITSSDGNGATPLVGMRIPASGGTYLHTEIANSGQSVFVSSYWLSIAVIDDQIAFSTCTVNGSGAISVSPFKAIAFGYEVFIYRNTG